MIAWHNRRARTLWLAFSILIIMLLVPLMRYRPACGDWREISFDGPMRSVYIESLIEILDRESIFYIRIGNEIFFRIIDSYEISNISPITNKLYDILKNWEWRIAYAIFHGYGPYDIKIQPPQALLDAMEDHDKYLDRKTAPQREIGMIFTTEDVS